MSSPTVNSAPQKAAYQRPYKSRSQRREADRRKHDESGDLKFLIKVAVGIVALVVAVLAFAIKGMG